MAYKIGDKCPVWWNTGETNEDGRPLGTVLAVRPYTGAYPQWFTQIVRLTAPSTKRGWLEMSV